jgi:hypothetical protein
LTGLQGSQRVRTGEDILTAGPSRSGIDFFKGATPSKTLERIRAVHHRPDQRKSLSLDENNASRRIRELALATPRLVAAGRRF